MAPIIETQATESQLSKVRKMLDKAEAIGNMPVDQLTPELLAEATALNERAAQLIAQYGIDRAMLAADGKQGDEITDEVFIIGKPFSSAMSDLLWNIASPLRANARAIKRYNPDLKGGRKKGGYEYGLRIFAYESDLARIKLLYTSLRNQALSGMSRIVDTSSTYGQTQKAERESYLEGFRSAVYWRLRHAEEEAQKVREAEQRELQDRAMLEGGPAAGPGVALVLADRRTAVAKAMDRAYGITQADRDNWAARDEEYRKQRKAEMAECPRCKNSKPCRKHGTASGGRSYERVGSRWSEGYDDGQRADLSGTSRPVGRGQKELED